MKELKDSTQQTSTAYIEYLKLQCVMSSPLVAPDKTEKLKNFHLFGQPSSLKLTPLVKPDIDMLNITVFTLPTKKINIRLSYITQK